MTNTNKIIATIVIIKNQKMIILNIDNKIKEIYNVHKGTLKKFIYNKFLMLKMLNNPNNIKTKK